MVSCSDMKKGDIYVCPDCGLELQVVNECAEKCGCHTTTEPCGFSCCGKELVKKTS